jgi:hypothetical protein
MGKGDRRNLERLLCSAWEYQRRQEVLSISPKLHSANKPESSLVRKFFANAFVQAVLVFIALAVAFSGKLDTYGTTAAIFLGWGIGTIGIWTHCSNGRSQKIVAFVLIVAYSGVLRAFENYLTGKSPTTSAPVTQPAPPSSEPPKKFPDLRWRYDVEEFGYLRDDETKQKKYAPGGSNIIVAGEVSNVGEMPSIARNWQLTVRMAGEQQIRLTNMLAPGRTTLRTGPPKQDFLEMSFKDYLPEVTTTEAIASGFNKVGFVVFAIPHITDRQIGKAGNTLTLGFEDVTGRAYKFDLITTGAMDQLHVSIPGMIRVN